MQEWLSRMNIYLGNRGSRLYCMQEWLSLMNIYLGNGVLDYIACRRPVCNLAVVVVEHYFFSTMRLKQNSVLLLGKEYVSSLLVENLREVEFFYFDNGNEICSSIDETFIAKYTVLKNLRLLDFDNEDDLDLLQRNCTTAANEFREGGSYLDLHGTILNCKGLEDFHGTIVGWKYEDFPIVALFLERAMYHISLSEISVEV